MLIELSNGRKFLVKVTYKANEKDSITKDKYGRIIYKTWTEHDTLVFVSEWFKEMPDSMVKFVGITHCSYKDLFKKSIGRKIAYLKAVKKMVDTGIISGEEVLELTNFNLNKNEYNLNNKE